MKIFILALAAMLMPAPPAQASALAPLCEADVIITRHNAQTLAGKLANTDCPELGYEGKTVSVTILNEGYPVAQIDALRLKAWQVSAMGPHGHQATGHQWEIASLSVDGEAILQIHYPMIRVEETP